DLYLFNLLHLIKTAEYAKTVKKKKLEKLRPTEDDLAFQPKLAENELILSLQNNAGLRREFQFHKTHEKVFEDKIRLLYKEFSNTEDYKAYIKNGAPSYEDHRHVVSMLYKSMIGNEIFEDTLDENYLFWEDDKSLIVGAMKK